MAEFLRIRCRGCEVKLKAPVDQQGTAINCPRCGYEIQIPVLNDSSKQDTATSPPNADASVAAVLTPVENPRAGNKPTSETTDREPPIASAAAADTTLADPWEAETPEYNEYDDASVIRSSRRRRKKIAEARAEQPRRSPKPKAKKKSGSGDLVSTGSIVGGFGLIFGGIAWFLVGWNNGETYSEPFLLAILGIAGIINGIRGE